MQENRTNKKKQMQNNVEGFKKRSKNNQVKKESPFLHFCYQYYPDASGGVLTRLEKKSNVATHLPHDHLSLVPQQLDPGHGHLGCRFAARVVWVICVSFNEKEKDEEQYHLEELKPRRRRESVILKSLLVLATVMVMVEESNGSGFKGRKRRQDKSNGLLKRKLFLWENVAVMRMKLLLLLESYATRLFLYCRILQPSKASRR